MKCDYQRMYDIGFAAGRAAALKEIELDKAENLPFTDEPPERGKAAQSERHFREQIERFALLHDFVIHGACALLEDCEPDPEKLEDILILMGEIFYRVMNGGEV